MNAVETAARYAERIIDGKTPACGYVIKACQRFADDCARQSKKNWPYHLDVDEANRWCRFLAKLPHVKGKWAAKQEKFKPSDWQIFCTVNIYGWRHKKTGLRRFREAYVEVPRKNGKSYWVAGLGVGHLTIDNEFGAEVYCGATTEKQAWEVFRPAKQICERTAHLRERFGLSVNAKTLVILQTGGKFEPVIGNPGDGPGPSCAIVDEFHEHKTAEQADTFETGMGARDQPLMFYITTAGSDMGGPCYAKRDECIKILNGSIRDDRIFAIIYTLDDGEAWDTIAAQKKANPNYGVSISPDFLEGKLSAARRSAFKQSAYRTKHLNQWVGAKQAWMNMLAFQACRRKRLKLEALKGLHCFAALDLASKTDIAALALLFPPQQNRKRWAAFCKHYLPEATVEDGNTRYRAWHADGWLTSTPGNVTDFGYIKDDLADIKSTFQITEIPYDPFQATQLATELLEDGYPMVEYGATVKNFSEPMKELEALILKKGIDFDSDPVLLWMFGNVVAKLDKKDNVFPDKQRPENKIDGVVALIMAMGRALAYRGDSFDIDDFLADPLIL